MWCPLTSSLKLIQENVQRINRHHLALFNTEQTHLWLAFWCDFFGALLVVATCLLSVAFSDELGPANVGLAISNSIQVSAKHCTRCCAWCFQGSGSLACCI